MTGKGEANGGEGVRRWSPRRKRVAVLRLLKGEPIDTVSRELRVPVHQLRAWQAAFVAGGTGALKSRRPTEPGELKAARAKIGELLMKLELLEKKDQLLAQSPKWRP